jgi:ABC-type sugar transport system ATPase subunit
MAELVLTDICKSFGDGAVLESIDLSVADGEFLVILGPSGCGKSTLLRLIAGLETADCGQILIGGDDVADLAPKDRDVAMVFQNYALYPHMTVFDNIAFPLKMKRTPRVEASNKVNEVAKMLGLSEMLDRKPRTLSGGQRQRVAVGRAIVRSPALFLFDEPLSNLDAGLRVAMRTEIRQLMSRLNATALYVTHDQEEALTMGDRIAVLSEGKIAQLGTPQEIYDKPTSVFVAAFVGSPSMNVLDGIVRENGSISIDDESVLPSISLKNSYAGRPVKVGFRPESCSIGEGWAMKVESSEFFGNDVYVYGRVSGQRITVRVDPAFQCEAVDVLGILPRIESVHVFDSNGNRLPESDLLTE